MPARSPSCGNRPAGPATARTALLRTGALAALLLAAPVPGSGSPQLSRPLALRDFYQLVEVSDAAISPDGSRVAYVRTAPLQQENRYHSEIWLADADGSIRPRRLTSASFEARSPVWSPDGRTLAFRSSRPGPGGETESTWFLDLEAGGEAWSVDGVDGDPVYSPDGLWIAFVREAPVGGEAAVQSTYGRNPYELIPEFERDVRERFEGRAVEWMGYRYDGSDELADPRDPVATPPRELWVVPTQRNATPRQLTRLGFDVANVAWSPDSQRIAFVADSQQRDEHTYERHDLWTVDFAGRVVRVTDDEYVWSDPVWSTDGTALFARRELGLDAVIAAGGPGAPVEVVRLDPATGSLTELTGDWDLVPETLERTPAGELRFLAVAGGERQLFAVPAGGGAVRAVTGGRRWIGDLSHDAAGARIAYVSETASQPAEVFVAAADGSGELRVSHANDVVTADAAFGDARTFSYASVDGTEIQGWLMLPPGYRAGDAPLPLIVSIHGGPHGAYGESFNFQFQLWANEGYAVLYTNPRASLGYGEPFLWATWGGGWGALDTEDVLAGVDAAAGRVEIDPDRIGVSGYSYGGFLTNMLVAKTDRFAAAISGAGISNWISDYGTADIPRTKESEFYGPPWVERSAELLWEASPIRHVAAATTPTLFLHGERDWRVPIEQAEQMYTALRKQRVPARFVRYPEASHGQWTPADRVHFLLEGLDWWRRWLERER